ncbi:MAG TPA: ATP-binding protein [Candidatus Eisenbacteria bacterium]|nr:ATP-binding protein [Candidatus Eisenbacteria bacterium]
MGRVRLKTKLVLAISGMVTVLVALFCYIYVSHRLRQSVVAAYDRAEFIAKEIEESAREATQIDFPQQDLILDDPKLIQAALENRLQHDPGLNTLLQTILAYSKTTYDAGITDVNGRVIVHTDPTVVGTSLERREDFNEVLSASFIRQLRTIYGPPRVYDLSIPIQRGEGQRFGNIRVGISTVFLKHEVQPQLERALAYSVIAILMSLALAAGVSNLALRPLEAIGRRLDQMTAEVPDSNPQTNPGRVDEFGLVNTKIERLGRQIRDVKEVFSTLKGNLDQIMGTLQDGLVLFTRDNHVVLVSTSAERFIGRTREEFLGKGVEEIFTDASKLGQIVLDAFALHQAIPQREIELENGRRVQLALDFIAERGERIGALLTMRDAESVRRLENELELSRRLAAIGRLTSGVAHEVKNPINAIVVHLELLREKMREVDPNTRRHMDIIDNEIHRLDRVVQTLVDFNRPVELRLSSFDLRRLVEEVAMLAAPEAALQGVEVKTQIGPDSLPVRADNDLVRQALLNVVLNGVQAMEDGGLLTIAAGREDNSALIEVRDQGIGIAPKIQDKVFNLYFTTKKSGSGIGLAMTYRVLQMHSGSLDFVTEPGVGTTFRLLMPLAGIQSEQREEVRTESAQPARTLRRSTG